MQGEPRCGNCRFFFSSEVCRRYPPTVVAYVDPPYDGRMADAVVASLYPEVNENGWCGEHQLKPVAMPPIRSDPPPCPECRGMYVACDVCRGSGLATPEATNGE